ncbi:MAG: IS91 family transposase [Chloroflexota bacterium]
MVRLADIVRECGDVYQERYHEQLLPSHKQALRAIEQCRTPAMGGAVYHCGACEVRHYQYHSCRNRHCPQCQHQVGEDWLEKRIDGLLPTHYFMLTFTLPESLRSIARSNQKFIYSLLFRCAASATQQLAKDERHIGGKIGLIGVLHTWGRNLTYHPHVHFLAPGGGLASDGLWRQTSHNFFLPVKALSILFRAKMREALQKTEIFEQIPNDVWQSPWVVHCKPVGKGEATLKYLAPYIFRVAISDRRIMRFVDEKVTFRFRQSDTGKWLSYRLGAFEFLRRFLQHVLPKGFVKVRYYGLFSPSNKADLANCLQLLLLERPKLRKRTGKTVLSYQPTCPACGIDLILVFMLQANSRCPP